MTVSLKDFVQVRKVMAEPFAFGTQVAPVLVVRRNEQRDFFDDLDAVAPHRVQLSRVVGQQPHRAYAQILQDLSGPKVRLGEFAPFVLKRGETLHLCEGASAGGDVAPGGPRTLPLPVPELLAALKPNARLLLDDGKVELRVTACGDRVVSARCTVGGELKPRKGITALGVEFNVPAVTAKDRDDLRFGLEARPSPPHTSH